MSNINDSEKVIQKGIHEMKKSGYDWLNYVQGHPLQTMFFGLVGYFALRGVFKE